MDMGRQVNKAGIPVFGMMAGILFDHQMYGSGIAALVVFVICCMAMFEL